MRPPRLFTNAADLAHLLAPAPSSAPAWARWEWGFLAGITALALALGLSNLGAPSLWHDELVHVYVAKHIADHGWPALPSGAVYPSSTAYNYLLALFVGFFGDAEHVVRLPSVLLSGVNAAGVYLLCRLWLGRPAAVAAALLFVTSPWQVAWARQARLYEFQVSSYLLLLFCSWRYFTVNPRQALWYGSGAIGAYGIGILTSFHSILYLGPIGLFALGLGWRDRDRDLRWAWAVGACMMLGLLTILCFWLNPNPVDRAAVFQTGLGGTLVDHTRADRFYYFRFLANNLSLGYFLVAAVGAASLMARRDRNSLWMLAAFLVPVLVLTYLVGYRRFRFMFFAYPIYVMISAHGLVILFAALRAYRRSVVHALIAVVVTLFLGRLAYSTLELVEDSLETAGGAATTLAIKHPAWRKAGEWVREHLEESDAILTTTYLPAHYYAGRVSNWFPNRYTRWEQQESGLEGLESLEELRTFLTQHPRGYFIAEASRFMFWSRHGDLVEVLRSEYEWVESHMTGVEAASTPDDVCVWRWDFVQPDGTVVVP
jgi:4-amino-4-deoxy-L-arabinose transferase-like glycosyltransferase